MASIDLRCNGFTATVFDNEPSSDPPIGEGQNGLRIWRPDDDPEVRLIAASWLNLEHIITEDAKFSGPRKYPGFFEPRQVPIRLEGEADRVRLSHPPLPRTSCACWIEYTPGDRPHSLDFELGFTPTRHVGSGEVVGVFLPCYIWNPALKSIHFIGGGPGSTHFKWIEHCSSTHHSDANFAALNTEHPPAYEATDVAGFTTIARHAYPFITGNINDYGYVLMLEPEEGVDIRFWMSPSGGGGVPETPFTNPAWDFVALKFGYELNQEYRAKGRLVVRPMDIHTDSVVEYEAWSGQTVTWRTNS